MIFFLKFKTLKKAQKFEEKSMSYMVCFISVFIFFKIFSTSWIKLEIWVFFFFRAGCINKHCTAHGGWSFLEEKKKENPCPLFPYCTLLINESK